MLKTTTKKLLTTTILVIVIIFLNIILINMLIDIEGLAISLYEKINSLNKLERDILSLKKDYKNIELNRISREKELIGISISVFIIVTAYL